MLEETFTRGYNKLFQIGEEAVREFVGNVEDTFNIDGLESEYDIVSILIEKSESKIQKLIDLRLEDNIKPDVLNKKFAILKDEQDRLAELKKIAYESLESEKTIQMRIGNFRKSINGTKLLDEFDRLILDVVIENVVIRFEDDKGK